MVLTETVRTLLDTETSDRRRETYYERLVRISFYSVEKVDVSFRWESGVGVLTLGPPRDIGRESRVPVGREV